MRRVWCASLVALTVLCAACDGSAGGPTAPSKAGSNVNVVLTASPLSDAKALLVTFSSVDVHLTASAFVPLFFVDNAATRTCDIKKLSSAQDLLGTGPVLSGHYTQIRLHIASATLYFDNPSTGAPCAAAMAAPGGRSASVTLPSNTLLVDREFDVISISATTITLDFDGERSVTQMGNGSYTMSPVVSVKSVQQ